MPKVSPTKAVSASQPAGEPKHRLIRKHLQDLIESGSVGVGQRLPTESQLVRQFHVSRPTAAKALNELVAAGVLERRAGAGSFVSTKSPHLRESMIGLLIPGLGETEIFEPICSAIASQCPRHHLHLLWSDAPKREEQSPAKQALALCQKYVADKVSGVFWAPLELDKTMDDTNHQIAEMLLRAKIAIVLLDRDFETFPNRSRFDLVGINNVRAGYMQTEHLLRHGVRKVVYFARKRSADTVRQRIMGFHAAKNDFGLPVNEDDVVFGDPVSAKTIQAILAHETEAVVCANDITAAILMRSLLDAGVAIPQAMRVVGLDDVRYSSLFSIALTTLQQPCRAIGTAAVSAMVRRLENRQAPVLESALDCTLQVRVSCGCPQEKIE
ncbi:MAG: GntR family transcriptional regulator [Thermoguttaceae bacterium]